MGLFGPSKQEAALREELERRDAELARLREIVEESEARRKEWEQYDVFTQGVVPAVSQALMGSGVGFLAGRALQIFGRLAALGVGSSFVALQGASYLGYVSVDWRKARTSFTPQPF